MEKNCVSLICYKIRRLNLNCASSLGERATRVTGLTVNQKARAELLDTQQLSSAALHSCLNLLL